MDILKKYGIREDPRLKRARKEFGIVLLIWLLYTLVSLGYAFGVGGSNPNAVLLGLPWWFHFLTISVVFMVVIIYFTRRFVEDTDLSPWGSERREI